MPKFLVIDNGSIHTAALVRLLPNTPTIVGFDEVDSGISHEYDCIILSGSSRFPVIGNENLFSRELQLIQESEKPIIGICLGAELIIHAFGGVLTDLGEKQKGIIRITATDPKHILLEDGRNFDVYEAHRFATKEVPDQFTILAKSDHGPEIIKHRIRPIWGLQFHPEHLTDETIGDEIFSRIVYRSFLGNMS
ncbi:MAG: type 1 glutamine amidotransferase [Undibacterium sp.]